MLNHLHCNQNTSIFQAKICNLCKTIRPLYEKFVPYSIRHRRNVSSSKLSDTMLISLLCLQVSLKMTVQTRFYSFLKTYVFPHGQLPERSRFNRICSRAAVLLHYIREGIIRELAPRPNYTIIDSMPLPLCHPARNFRAKALKEVADIGYSAAKKEHYYGFKGSFQAGDNGIIYGYVLTKASIHDIKMVKSLIEQYKSSYILADKGYINEELKEELKKEKIWFWTPMRKNMKKKEENEKWLNKKRRYIETIFSKLISMFDIERIRVHSLNGFVSRLEQCLLVYTMQQLKIN